MAAWMGNWEQHTMKARSIKLGSSLALMLMASGSFFASANTNGYKMVIIEDTPGVAALQAGKFDQGINETLDSNSAEVDNFSRQMSLCVGFTKSNQLQQAEQACNSAVALVQQFTHVSAGDKREMRAHALSNRGVLRLSQNNNLAALADFKRAAELSRSEVSVHNLQRLELALNKANNGLDLAMTTAE
ncbi:hypothetical protein [Rheinheimera baltica]|uniref:hypothetical protein n=2 Tax=Rheinheimera baltica TaxID=67576 RepID=UPI00273F18AA|nr:hypothetical protein [Rheinheimera baltica]MDP5189102.1 hypothetical protein [Rheinheimera baltica]